MTKLALATIIVGLALIGGGAFLFEPTSAGAIPMAKVERGDVESVLTTNGRIEAAERYDVFAETSGRVLRVAVEEGDSVPARGALATLSDAEARDSLVAAQARLDESKAARAALEQGLSPSERLHMESELSAGRTLLGKLGSDLARTERLVASGATPAAEAEAIRERIDSVRTGNDLVASKLAVEATSAEQDRAEARVRAAQAEVDRARRHIGAAIVRAPLSGVVYSLGVRAGSYVTPGALVARIASQTATQALVYVDEPELGRVEVGDQARVTADAFPGRDWICKIDRLPSEVIELGSRRVGALRCVMENGSDQLIPNLTVDVEIVTARAEGVGSVVREAVVRAAGDDFVWLRDSEGRAQRRSVQLGVRGIDRVEISAGLAVGDEVLLPGAREVAEGDEVRVAP